MSKYQDLLQTYPGIDGTWNKLSDAVMNSDLSLPEFIGAYIDALGGMRACFKPAAIDAMSLRFLAQSTFNNIQMDETMIETTWTGEIMRACSNVLTALPQGPLNEADFRTPSPEASASMAEPARIAVPSRQFSNLSETPVSMAGPVPPLTLSEPPTAPFSSADVYQEETVRPVETFAPAMTTPTPRPPSALAVPEGEEPALSSAAARAFGLTSRKPTTSAPTGTAAVALTEFGDDMPLPLVKADQPESSAMASVPAELPPLPETLLIPTVFSQDHTEGTDQGALLPANIPVELQGVASTVHDELEQPANETQAVSQLAAGVPEATAPSAPVRPTQDLPSQAEDLDLQTLETELEQVFEFPQPDQVETMERRVEDLTPDTPIVAESLPVINQQLAPSEPGAQVILAPASVEETPQSSPANDLADAQPDAAPAASLFADPAVFERAAQLFQEVRDSVSDYIPRGASYDEFVGLPDDLRPENPALASIYLNSGPIVIAQRAPGAPITQELAELKRRVTAAFEQPLYKSRPFLDHWILANYCTERMLAGCFSASGAMKDAKEAGAFIAVLGRIALYSDYFMATPLGMDLFETAMRMAHSLDPASANVSPNHMPAVRNMREQIDSTIRLIAKVSAEPNMMPPIYPYVVDWLAKMMAAITDDAKTTDFDSLRDLSVGLSMVIIRCFGLGTKEIDSRVVSVGNYFNHLVNKAFWC